MSNDTVPDHMLTPEQLAERQKAREYVQRALSLANDTLPLPGPGRKARRAAKAAKRREQRKGKPDKDV